MKRFLSILLVAVFALSLCACSGNSDTPAPSTTATESAAPAGSTGSVADQGTSTSTGTKETKDFQIPTDLPPVKIGCVGAYSGNELYIQWKENLKSLEKDFNVSSSSWKSAAAKILPQLSRTSAPAASRAL